MLRLRGGHCTFFRQSQEAFMATLHRLCLAVPSPPCSCSSSSSFQLFAPHRLLSLHMPSHTPPPMIGARAAHSSSSSSPSPISSVPEEDWDLPQPPQDEWFPSDAGNFPAAADSSPEQNLPAWCSAEPDEEWYRAQAEDEEWFRREEEIYEARLSEREEWGRQPGARSQAQPDYLALSESSLFAQCRMDTFRASGPGGQHRNKTDSGVRLTHLPTGVVAQAVDDRSQHKNRAVAMNRLRFLIAAKVRRPLKLRGYKPPPELVRLLPAETGKKSSGDKIGVNHPDYAKGVQALLDLLAASQGYMFYAASVLRVSPGALSKILTSDKTLLQATNELLISKGQKPFK